MEGWGKGRNGRRWQHVCVADSVGTLLRVLAQVRSSCPDSRLWLVSNGPMGHGVGVTGHLLCTPWR